MDRSPATSGIGAADVAVEDARSFKEEKKEALYAPHVKIYPKAVSGLFRQINWSALIGLLAIYYIVPWIRWDRGPTAPDQAVLIDLPSRRGYFFWIEIWPQEVYYLTFILILAAFGLFLATSFGGRVWCGYACPQTARHRGPGPALRPGHPGPAARPGDGAGGPAHPDDAPALAGMNRAARPVAFRARSSHKGTFLLRVLT
jgi:hypothetical protein